MSSNCGCSSTPCSCSDYTVSSGSCSDGTDGTVILEGKNGGTTVGTGYEDLGLWSSETPTDLDTNGDGYMFEAYYTVTVSSGTPAFSMRILINGSQLTEWVAGGSSATGSQYRCKVFIQRAAATSVFKEDSVTAGIFPQVSQRIHSTATVPNMDSSAFNVSFQGKSTAGGTVTLDRFIVKLYKKRV